MRLQGLIYGLSIPRLSLPAIQRQVIEKTALQPEQSEDLFETPETLSLRTAELVFPETSRSLEKLKTLILKTAAVVDGCHMLDLKIKVRELQKQVDELQESIGIGEAPLRSTMLTLRKQMCEAEKSITQAQKRHLARSFDNCSKPVLAKLEALTIIQAISDDNIEYVRKRLPSRPKENEALASDREILSKFDSHLLQMFASKGIIQAMSVDEYEETQARLLELPELEQFYESSLQQCEAIKDLICNHTGSESEKRDLLLLLSTKNRACNQIALQVEVLKDEQNKLEKAFYLRDHFYLTTKSCHSMLARLSTLLKEGGIAIASRPRMGKQIIESLFRGHFELFCAFGIIERLSPSELNVQARQGDCNPNDFLKMGNHYCRFSNSGIYVLKDAMSLCDPLLSKMPVAPKPKPVAEVTTMRPPPREPRFPDYAVIPLDVSVEFY